MVALGSSWIVSARESLCTTGVCYYYYYFFALGISIPESGEIKQCFKKIKLCDVLQCASVGELRQIVRGRTSM